MKTKKWLLSLWTICAVLCFASCVDENKWDDPAGNQKNPAPEVPEPPADTSAKLLARYTFEGDLINEIDNSQRGQALVRGNNTLPVFESETERGGTVIHQYFGAVENESYIQFPNPLKGEEDLYGASVSLWINRTDGNVWDAIWAFLDEDNSDGVEGRFYLTPNAYLGFNGTGGYFDCNWPENVTDAIPVGEWAMVTVTIDHNGFTIYVNGKWMYNIHTQLGWGSDMGSATEFSYSYVMNLLASAADFYLGYGSWWGSADLLIDDLLIYKNVLTAAEVGALYDSYSGLVAYYTFESNLTNIVNESQVEELGGNQPYYTAEDENWKSTYLYMHFGAAGGESYVKFSNPLKGLDINGATVSVWINRLDANVWDGIWSFLDEDDSDGISGRFYLTPNAYLGFNGTGGWFDCNWPDNATDAIPVAEWALVTVAVSDDAFKILINGVERYSNTFQNSWNSNDGATSPAEFNYSHIINLLKSADNFFLGYGSWWGSPNILVDDLMIYSRYLSNSEIRELYNANKPE